jgi:predicted amino acid dehydrogenase
MKTVIGVSLGPASRDFRLRTRLLGQVLAVRRLGTDGSTARALALLREWDGRADAIGLGLVKDSARVGRGTRDLHERGRLGARLRAAVMQSPLSTGARLADLMLEWAVRRAQVEAGRIFDNARVLFFDGTAQLKVAQALAEVTPNLRFADPVRQLGVPKLLGSLDALALYAQGTHAAAQWVPPRLMNAALLGRWADHTMRRAIAHAHVVVAPVHELDRHDLEELAGKIVVTTTVSDERLAQLRDKGVQLVIDAAPQLAGHALDPALLDAMILAASDREAGALLDDDYLSILSESELDLAPRLLYPGGWRRTSRFAFVIHPLSQEYFKVVEPVRVLSRLAPPALAAPVMDTLEKVLAWAPPFVYSRVEGIRSPTGAEAEGWLISVGGTPREIMGHPPEFTYRRLLAAARMARRLGAQIMGLGAFTKVVGDAGVTVARQAPLPITTGNSYSASAALWAAHDALLRMRLLPRPRGKRRVKFKAMVVGATGAIGAACARLLARAAEEVWLVSPETAKLLALKASILADTPDAKLHLAARADPALPDMDMVVTATSGAGRKVLDIMKVKPGCVITDVARPLDLPPEEVARRPDVLVIESGEILLPGDVKMKDIGLPPGVVYACLAETIVLALAGRFENYTVGRRIEWSRVHEIYKLGLEHGMRLAAISGVNGVFSDADIERVRERALEERARLAAAARPAAHSGRRARPAQAAEPPTALAVASASVPASAAARAVSTAGAPPSRTARATPPRPAASSGSAPRPRAPRAISSQP